MIKEQLASLDSVTLNLGSGTGILMSIVLALIMFGVALGIKAQMLKKVFTQPKAILTGLVLQWLALPAVTFLLIMLLKAWLTPMICLGMLLVASCPGGNVSNFISSFAKGNVELSVSMTALSTVCSPVITPANFYFWGTLYLNSIKNVDNLSVPYLSIPLTEIFTTVFLILAIPVILALLFTKFFPQQSEKMRKPFSIFSLIVFFAMVLGMFIPNWQLFIKYIGFVFLLVLLHNACALGTGFCGAKLMRLPKADVKSLTIEVGIQNSGLGLTLLLNPFVFNPEVWNNPSTGVMYGGMLFVTAWWGIWHIISGLAVASIFRKK